MPGEITKDATLTVGVEGVEDVARAADKALDPWKKASEKASKDWGKFGADVGRSLGGVIQDIARAATVLGTLDVGKAAEKFRGFQEQTARFGATTGQSVASLQERFIALAKAQPEFKVDQYTATSSALQRMTGDGRGAVEIMARLAKQAVDTNDTLDNMGGLAKSLRDSFNVGLEQTPDMIDAINTAGERSGQAGGAGALQRQMKALAPTISKLNISDPRAFTNMMSQLGNGLSEQQQTEVQQRAMSVMTRDPEILRRRLGAKRSDFYDSYGRVNFNQDFATKWLKLVQGDVGKKNVEGVLMQDQNLGPMATAAVMKLDPLKIARQTAQPNIKGDGLDKDVRASMAAVQSNELDQMQGVGGKMAEVQGWWAKTFEGHPIAQQIAQFGGLGALGLGARYGLPALGAKLFGAAGGAASGAMPLVAETMPWLVAAGGSAYAGYKGGQMADEKLGLSDGYAEFLAKLTGVTTPKQAQLEVAEEEKKKYAARGEIDPGTQASLVAAITDALASINLSVNVINQSDSPIEATDSGRAKSNGRQ